MKKNSILLLTFILFTNLLFAQSNFDRGFEVGYKKGFCQDQGIGCIEPVTPVSPVPGANESYNSYSDGYNRGFTIALKKRNSKKSNSSFRNSIPKYERPVRKYNKTQSRINHNLIGTILREKQRAIDKEKEYLASLSYEEIKALIKRKQYSERKNHLYSKNLKRWIKADKKQKKIDKKFAKQIKKNAKIFYKSRKIDISELRNGWHRTMVKFNTNNQNTYVERLIYFENGTIKKYVGGTGFLGDIYNQSKTKPYEIMLEVGYEKNETAEIYVSFLKNNPIKLKEEPIYPTLIKFYTTTRNEGKMTIYLNGENFSDYFTLSKSFTKQQNITCEQTNGVVIFYVGEGNFEFYAHNSVNQWSGKVNTTNRYCIIKELSSY